jgi:endonuclease YncB( thermonuclease family)
MKGSVLALMAVVGMATTPALGSPIEPGAIEVVDGDTIRAGGRTFRLVGFDTPEMGSRSRCEHERALAAAASRRLRQLVAGAGLDLERVV